MAKYSVNGKLYETSLFGLVIVSDSSEETIFALSTSRKNWKKLFENDPRWLTSGDERHVCLIAKADNLREADRLVYYVNKEQAGNPDYDIIEVELSEADLAYLTGLLNQWSKFDITNSE